MAELDQVSVRIAQVAADLAVARDRRGQKVRTARAPELVYASNVGDAYVQRVTCELHLHRRDQCHSGFVLSRRPADIGHDPAVMELENDRIPRADDGCAEHLLVKAACAVLILDDKQVREAHIRVDVPIRADTDGGKRRIQLRLGEIRERIDVIEELAMRVIEPLRSDSKPPGRGAEGRMRKRKKR